MHSRDETPCRTSWRHVGDPVDVVTGAALERAVDLKLPGDPPFMWLRYYDSSRAGILGALGWGHTHEYERSLRVDLDGLSYEGPQGPLHFPALSGAGDTARAGEWLLTLVEPGVYQLRNGGSLALEFDLPGRAIVGRLVRLVQGRLEVRCNHRSDRLESLDLAGSRTLRFEYDESGLIRVVTIVSGRRREERLALEYEYSRGCLTRIVDAEGLTTAFAYDEGQRLIRRTDRRGYSFFFEYDGAGRCIRSSGQDGLHEVVLDHRSIERGTIVTRGDGGRWLYEYSDRGELTRIVDPCGGIRQLVYDDNGLLVEEVDGEGGITGYAYGGVGDLLARRLPTGECRHLPEDEGRRPRSFPVNWEFGLLLARVPPVTELTLPHDAEAIRGLPRDYHGLVLTSQNGLGAPRRVYDEAGRPVSETNPDGTERHWEYDPSGSLERVTDRDGSVYRIEHASWDLRTKFVDPLDRTIRYRYTTAGVLGAYTDPGGCTTEFDYDLKDRLVGVSRGGALRETYDYDRADRLVAKRDDHGDDLLTIEWSADGRRSVKTLGTGGRIELERDRRGRLVRARSDGADVAIRYDSSDNVAEDLLNGQGVRHRCQPRGLLAETDVLGRYITQYVQEGTTLTVRDPRGLAHELRFPGHGFVERRLANRSREWIQYDHNGRCAFRAVQGATVGTWTRTYRYSGEGDLLEVVDSRTGTWGYEYDAAHRLVVAIAPDGTRQPFVYDAANNLCEQPGLAGASFAPDNRILEAEGHEFGHDTRRHVSSWRRAGSAMRFHYDALDQLTALDVDGQLAEYAYDALGRRTRTKVGAAVTSYVWDGERLAAETDHTGRTRLYVYADQSALTPFLFIDYATPDTPPHAGTGYYIFCDHLAAPVLVEDDASQIVWQATYAPFGAAAVHPSSGISLALRRPGQYFDADSGLHYNRFRHYVPTIGRHLQSDPWGIGGGPNVYAASPNPLKHLDLRGLCPDDGPPNDPAPKKDKEQNTDFSDEPTNPNIRIPILTEDVNNGSIKIIGDEEFRSAVKADLERIETTPTGKQVLQDISDNHAQHGTKVDIFMGPASRPHAGHSADSNVGADGSPGKPSNTDIAYTPQNLDPDANMSRDVTTDRQLVHELDHGSRVGKGQTQTNQPADPNGIPAPNREEQLAVQRENDYARDRGQAPRKDYDHVPGVNDAKYPDAAPADQSEHVTQSSVGGTSDD